jgi:5-methylcytosine-specific restriction endonuclease McrA
VTTSRFSGDYPDNWPDIAQAVKREAGNCCIRCGHHHDRESGHVLTVHHLNGRKDDCAWFNLAALCQRCHLSIQSRVNMDRVWVMLPHSEWFRPYVAGHYARKYLGQNLTRDEVMARLDELLDLERQAVLGVAR